MFMAKPRQAALQQIAYCEGHTDKIGNFLVLHPVLLNNDWNIGIIYHIDNGMERAVIECVTMNTRRFLAIANDVWKKWFFFRGYWFMPGGSKKRRPQWPAGQAGVGFRTARGVAAFTLVEATIALGLLGICAVACLSAIVTNQVCDRKAKEEAIAMDFLTKYVENIKALPFTSVAPGLPINYIYNGAGGAPLITIPANSNWVSLSTTAFQTFYPDLLWLSNRNPMMQVTLAQNSVAGALHDIEINVKIDWNAPLAKGGRLEVEVDFLRTVDVPTL
jgi:hypothetical protein